MGVLVIVKLTGEGDGVGDIRARLVGVKPNGAPPVGNGGGRGRRRD